MNKLIFENIFKQNFHPEVGNEGLLVWETVSLSLAFNPSNKKSFHWGPFIGIWSCWFLPLKLKKKKKNHAPSPWLPLYSSDMPSSPQL